MTASLEFLIFRGTLVKVGARYRQIHPDTHFQFGVYPEDQMVEVMRRRSRGGLAPDLLLVNGDTALRLRQAGLVDPFPIRKDQLAIFNEEELGRLRSPDGRLAGLPVTVQTQLGCFNRQRLSEPPSTLPELLDATANGHPMGLSLDLYYLFWIVGSTGALPAIDKAVLGQPLNPAEREALTGWLAWLQNASNQQRVTFFPDQPTAEAEFKAGRLDWIPCRSTVLPQLRQVMGSALGVAPLPDGDGHRASPINRLRVLALGRSSSAAGVAAPWPSAFTASTRSPSAPSPWDPRRCCQPIASSPCRCRAPRCWPPWWPPPTRAFKPTDW